MLYCLVRVFGHHQQFSDFGVIHYHIDLINRWITFEIEVTGPIALPISRYMSICTAKKKIVCRFPNTLRFEGMTQGLSGHISGLKKNDN